MTARDKLELLTQHWVKAGIVDTIRSSPQQVREFERRHRIHLPTEMRRFFTEVGGMPVGIMDAHYLRLWPLTELNALKDELPDLVPTGASYFCFADFSVDAHTYAIAVEGSKRGRVIRINGGYSQVAASYAEFISRYLEDPSLII
jgi:hypothetical protein